MSKGVLLLAFAMLASFSACSHDQSEELSEKTSTTIQSDPVTMQVDLSATMEQEDLEEGMRGIKILFKEKTFVPELTLTPGETVPLNLVFSNGSGSMQHIPVNFTIKSDKKLEYKGDIAINGFNTTTKWYVTAFYAGTKTGDAYYYAPNHTNMGPLGSVNPIDMANTHTISIPYMSGWTPVSARMDAGKLKGSFKVALQPMGSIVHYPIKNKRNHPVRLRNIILPQGSQDFAFNARFTPVANKQNFESGALPTVSVHDPGAAYKKVTFYQRDISTKKNGTDIAAGGELTGSLVWVMPLKKNGVSTLPFKLETRMMAAEWYWPFNIRFNYGKSGWGGNFSTYTLNLPNDNMPYRQLYPLDYIATGNIAANGNQVAVGQTGATWTWDSYPYKNSSENMTRSDWEAILPRSNAYNYTPGDYSGGSLAPRDGTRFFGGTGSVNRSDSEPTPGQYRSARTVVYALRTVNGLRAGFRYELASNGTMTVEMVPLTYSATPVAPPDNTGAFNAIDNLNAIANEAYWAEARRWGDVAKRVFPGTGADPTWYMGVENGTLSGTMWNYSRGRVGMGLPNSSTNQSASRMVRLKKSRPQPVQ